MSTSTFSLVRPGSDTDGPPPQIREAVAIRSGYSSLHASPGGWSCDVAESLHVALPQQCQRHLIQFEERIAGIEGLRLDVQPEST